MSQPILHKLTLRSPTGVFRREITDILDWDCSRAENQAGAFTLTLPGKPYSYDDFPADSILEFRRSWDGGRSYVHDKTAWFVRTIDIQAEGKSEVIALTGHDTLGLPARRVVAWWSSPNAPAGLNTYAYKTQPADSMIIEVLRQNFIDLVGGLVASDVPPSAGGPTANGIAVITGATTADRRMQPLTYSAAAGVAPTIAVEMAWKNCMSVFADIAKASFDAGRRLIYDIEYAPPPQNTYTFKIYLDRRGVDRTVGSAALTFGLDYENVDKISLKRDYNNESTWVHALGPGQGSSRITVGVISSDPLVFKRSPFYPIESTVDATKSSGQDSLTSAGRAELQKKKAKFTLTANAINNGTTIFGRDFNYGDTVNLTHRGIVSQCRVSKYRIRGSKGVESVDIPLATDEDLTNA